MRHRSRQQTSRVDPSRDLTNPCRRIDCRPIRAEIESAPNGTRDDDEGGEPIRRRSLTRPAGATITRHSRQDHSSSHRSFSPKLALAAIDLLPIGDAK